MQNLYVNKKKFQGKQVFVSIREYIKCSSSSLSVFHSFFFDYDWIHTHIPLIEIDFFFEEKKIE